MGFLYLAASLLGVDQFLKDRIEEQEASEFPRIMEGTKGFVKLYQNHNPGFCFEFLKGEKDLVTMVPFGFTSGAAGVLFWLLTKKGKKAEKLGFSLVLSGAVSNLYDRMKRGYVVDYFSFQMGALKKIVFNIGDLCILLGAAILAVRNLLVED